MNAVAKTSALAGLAFVAEPLAGLSMAGCSGRRRGENLLERYHVLEPRIQGAHPEWTYRAVMAAVLAELGRQKPGYAPR